MTYEYVCPKCGQVRYQLVAEHQIPACRYCLKPMVLKTEIKEGE